MLDQHYINLMYEIKCPYVTSLYGVKSTITLLEHSQQKDYFYTMLDKGILRTKFNMN